MANWIIRASICYDMGSIRKNNEDAYYFNGEYAKFSKMANGASLTTEVKAADSLWAVCDGMGGQSNGERASYTAVSGMQDLQDHLHGRDFETTIQSWVHQANRAVNEQAAGGGSTLAMIYCTDQYLQTAHIGDSRIYRYHEGELIRVTRDHSKVEMLLETKMITPEEAINHPQKNVITRYLGMNSEYICDATVGKKIPYCNGDRYLICSDGITDMMRDEEIAAVLAENLSVSDCAERIKEKVFEAGARDNMTVIVLEFYSPDPMDTILNEEELFPEEDDDEPTVEEEETDGEKKTECQVNIHINSKDHCEVVLQGGPSKVSLNII